jgi:hypothetical protein
VKGIFFGASSAGDFYIHKYQYESIVQSVKAANMAVMDQQYWVVSQWSNPVKLRRLTPSQKPPTLAGQVAAHRTRTGYIISIVTSDNGHFGTAGYIFSDAPLKPIQGDSYTSTDAPGDLSFLEKRINDNWWTAYNNLH